eukprot:TRINITY_DN109279_c0_g1_i1.p1 TRINITY_DN109279_c0_g1~~TRINITY_DN109279_c0_g1_i1.p1  ORF type:complete len:737 (+),score=95.19 TRINITY_DN109279_c0_g1_i1:244-2211(+)
MALFGLARFLFRVFLPWARTELQWLPCAMLLSSLCLRIVTCFGRRWIHHSRVLKIAAICMLIDTTSFSLRHPDVTGVLGPDATLEKAARFGSAVALKAVGTRLTRNETLQDKTWKDSLSNDELLEVFAGQRLSRYKIEDFIENANPSVDFDALRTETIWSTLRYTFEYALATLMYHLCMWYSLNFLLVFRDALPAIVSAYVIHVSILLSCGIAGEAYVRLRILDLSLIGMSTFVMGMSKWQNERYQRQAFQLFEQRRHETVKEKVLRFQAEFTEHQLRERLHVLSSAEDDGTPSIDTPAVPDLRPSPNRRGDAPSIRSAPLLMGKGAITVGPGQCLHPQTWVWPESSKLPKRVAEIESSELVLCYDNVTGSLTFAEVTENQQLAGDVPWVSVTMSDGSSMTLTENHPVQPVSAPDEGSLVGGNIATVISAKELQAGRDYLPMFKLAPTMVQKVEAIPADTVPSTRRALGLKCPGRYSVFIADPNESCPEQAPRMAVSSAGLQPKDSSVHVVVRSTFVDVVDLDPLPLQRSNSAPSDLCQGWELSPSNDSVLIDVAEAVAEREVSTHEATEESLLRQVQSLGLNSIGSLQHAHGNCRICVYQHAHRMTGSAPCNRGALCSYCHENHEDVGPQKLKRKSGAMQRAARAAARLQQAVS